MSLHILHVQVHVRPESIDAFREATLKNAQGSRAEPGVLRFDVLQDTKEPARFVLVEVYRDTAAHAAHRETAHYLAWRDAVTDMMAETRSSRTFVNVDPGDGGW